ncbi:serine/threonine protein kinase [Leifsonia shinshuensis]|nr:serine/threonine protein kinase [Leifsonia shinshuensis]
MLDRYELREPLGRGGMATVYRADDRELGRSVAIKLFVPGRAADGARRRSEAMALARLSHPNLVCLYDAHLSADDDLAPSYLVMELVEGEDLGTRLDRGPLPGAEVAAIAAGIAEALVVVHAAGIVHRDLKPANILLADSEVPGGMPHAKLTDFGIAHLMGAERVTTAGTIIGTAGFLSPEQSTGAEPGPAADVYSLGLVVLEALTGVREYPGTPVEAVTARLVRDPRIPASLPEEWRGLIGAMTSRDPHLRPTALEVAVMARELAPQLAGWVAPGPVADSDRGGEAPTAAMPPAVLPVTGPAPLRRPRNGGRAARRRRRLTDGALLVSGVTAIVAVALSLGIVFAPAAPAARSEPTHRPTPTVTAPPQTVEPADTTQPPPPAAPAQHVQQPPAPQKGDHPGKGSGKNNGKSNGSGNGKGKG